MGATRREHDFLGELEIPADVYYGIQTSRAVENFKISGITISSMPRFIQALGQVKKAAALANMELGNELTALEHIQRAIQMDPGNSEYRKILALLRQTGESYRQNGRGFSMDASQVQKFCCQLCAAHLFCRFCCG